jgi:hypothetical protein
MRRRSATRSSGAVAALAGHARPGAGETIAAPGGQNRSSRFNEGTDAGPEAEAAFPRPHFAGGWPSQYTQSCLAAMADRFPVTPLRIRPRSAGLDDRWASPAKSSRQRRPILEPISLRSSAAVHSGITSLPGDPIPLKPEVNAVSEELPRMALSHVSPVTDRMSQPRSWCRSGHGAHGADRGTRPDHLPVRLILRNSP